MAPSGAGAAPGGERADEEGRGGGPWLYHPRGGRGGPNLPTAAVRRALDDPMPTTLLSLALATAVAGPVDPAVDDVVTALSARHTPASCAALEADLADPAGTWVHIAETVPSPPWVAVRAARCAARHPGALPTLLAWFDRDDREGLARAVALDATELPEATAVAVIGRALGTSWADQARAVRDADPRPAVRAVARP